MLIKLRTIQRYGSPEGAPRTGTTLALYLAFLYYVSAPKLVCCCCANAVHNLNECNKLTPQRDNGWPLIRRHFLRVPAEALAVVTDVLHVLCQTFAANNCKEPEGRLLSLISQYCNYGFWTLLLSGYNSQVLFRKSKAWYSAQNEATVAEVCHGYSKCRYVKTGHDLFPCYACKFIHVRF